MAAYAEQFSDGGEIRWLPYVMYFHPAGHRSPVVNTDALGFRYSTWAGMPVSVADLPPVTSVDVLAGSSTVFGIGASCDGATLASRLNAHSPDRWEPWLNMGGRSHNSAQELVLHALNRHRLPRIGRIVLFSGFNDLGLARLPAPLRFDSGGFFLSKTFFDRPGRADRTDSPDRGHRRSRSHRHGRGRSGPADDPVTAAPTTPDGDDLLGIDDQIRLAADLVLRHLRVWRALADDAGAELIYVLQPLATWVRDPGTDEEEALFCELDRVGRFSEQYGDVSRPDVGRRYAEILGAGCAEMGVRFADMAPLLAAALAPDDWMFVDRIHYTDRGYDLAARLLVDRVL